MSKDAKNVPALRFKGYSDAWEKRKLGEVSPLRGGFAFRSSEFKDKGIPIIRISNIKSDGKVGGDFVYYHEQEVDQSYLLPQRAALLAMSGATTGKVAILHKQHEGKYYQNQRVGYFSKVKDASYSFISVLIRSDLFLKQLKSVLVAGAQPNVSSKEIDQFIFSVPATLNEQEKIGTFFEYLDSLIAATQHKIDALEQAKKALLQCLFDQSWRFKGYSDPWEKRKVSDYLCESRIPGSNGLKAKKLTVKLWGKGVVPKNETYSGSIKTKYYVRSANQLIYGKLDFLHAAFGIVPQSLDGWESTIDSPAFDVNTSIGNAAFLLALFLKPNFYLREGIRANGSRKAKRIHA
ncbi:restriction endonuclease subunit S [Lacticaseibacillus paracasei]|uniref:restriction endonuclease subunit S n=1 Tax=Lacticaseibacillus paracasei TaxID=1597 RepID=UPI004045D22C